MILALSESVRTLQEERQRDRERMDEIEARQRYLGASSSGHANQAPYLGEEQARGMLRPWANNPDMGSATSASEVPPPRRHEQLDGSQQGYDAEFGNLEGVGFVELMRDGGASLFDYPPPPPPPPLQQ